MEVLEIVQNNSSDTSSKGVSQLKFDIRDYDDEKRTIDFIFTTPDIDRSNDIVDINGIDIEDFKNNPVFLWVHDKTKQPLGRVVDMFKEDGVIKGTVEFWRNDLDPAYWSEHDKLALSIYEQYKRGFLKGVSIAFRPVESEFNKGTGGMIYKKIKLTEISAVPVPDNPNALSISKSLADIDCEIVKKYCEDTLKAFDKKHADEILKHINDKINAENEVKEIFKHIADRMMANNIIKEINKIII